MEIEPKNISHKYALLFQQGEEKGLSFFYHEFHPALSLYSFSITNNRQLAEEIASDAFVKTWKMHWKLDSYGAIRAYLYKIVHRDSLEAIRKEKKRKEALKKTQTPTTETNTPFDNIVRSEVYRIIHTALQDLTPANRRVLIMHYLEGKTSGQIARELKLHRSTINTQKTKGLEALRKKLLRPSLILFYVIVKIFFPFS
ncbi:MAG: sigma-70 family RNA polymerase sigma factor [Sphingobacteriales bacterium]|nr:MAG: sigma-70 family RNA polymerase sigma factor [Sphingobacteriales bacterium]